MSGEALKPFLRILEFVIEGGRGPANGPGRGDGCHPGNSNSGNQPIGLILSSRSLKSGRPDRKTKANRGVGRPDCRRPGYGDRGFSRSSDQVFFGGLFGGSGPQQIKGTDPEGYPSLSLEEVKEEMAQRDRQDQERALAPLRPAPDAWVLDTSGCSIDEVLQKMLAKISLSLPV